MRFSVGYIGMRAFVCEQLLGPARGFAFVSVRILCVEVDRYKSLRGRKKALLQLGKSPFNRGINVRGLVLHFLFSLLSP